MVWKSKVPPEGKWNSVASQMVQRFKERMSPSLLKCQCIESWNSENAERNRNQTLHCGCFAVGLTHERASSHCSEQYARTSLVVCEMCYVDSDCTRAKTPFLIVWTIVSSLFFVVDPLVTMSLGLCAAIHHVSYGCMSHNETVFGQALTDTGFSALTSCARTFLGHRCV